MYELQLYLSNALLFTILNVKIEPLDTILSN